MLVEKLNYLIVYLVLIGQIFLVFGILLFVIPKTRNLLFENISKHGFKLAFVVALVATLGSLYYSELLGYNPCKLCWYQRIFMYPQVLLLGLGIYRKEKVVTSYSYLLLLVGTVISLYHNYIYYNKVANASCGIDNTVACTTQYDLALGYMSIPLMSLTAFLLIGALLYINKKDNR